MLYDNFPKKSTFLCKYKLSLYSPLSKVIWFYILVMQMTLIAFPALGFESLSCNVFVGAVLTTTIYFNVCSLTIFLIKVA